MRTVPTDLPGVVLVEPTTVEGSSSLPFARVNMRTISGAGAGGREGGPEITLRGRASCFPLPPSSRRFSSAGRSGVAFGVPIFAQVSGSCWVQASSPPVTKPPP